MTRTKWILLVLVVLLIGGVTPIGGFRSNQNTVVVSDGLDPVVEPQGFGEEEGEVERLRREFVEAVSMRSTTDYRSSELQAIVEALQALAPLDDRMDPQVNSDVIKILQSGEGYWEMCGRLAEVYRLGAHGKSELLAIADCWEGLCRGANNKMYYGLLTYHYADFYDVDLGRDDSTRERREAFVVSVMAMESSLDAERFGDAADALEALASSDPKVWGEVNDLVIDTFRYMEHAGHPDLDSAYTMHRAYLHQWVRSRNQAIGALMEAWEDVVRRDFSPQSIRQLVLCYAYTYGVDLDELDS